MESISSSHARFTFDKQDILAAPTIEHTFTLRNDTKNPVVLERLGSSCGCTSAFAEKAPSTSVRPSAASGKPDSGSVSRFLLPGEKIAVHVSVDASRLRSGEAKKLVWVFTQDSGQPAATLEMVGVVQAPVTFTPSVLNFGKTPVGKGASLSLTVTFDSRLLTWQRTAASALHRFKRSDRS